MSVTNESSTDYQFDGGVIATPALAIYVEHLENNIERAKQLIGSNHWRPHVKTSKLAFTLRKLVQHGIRTTKCATTLELLTACQNSVEDVLVAYPLTPAGAGRVLEIAAQFPSVRISTIVENASQVDLWRGTPVGLFIDVNPGMNRTGIEISKAKDIRALAHKIVSDRLQFRGLHYYEGHHTQADIAERERAAHDGYDELLEVIGMLEESGLETEELVTSGTPAFPCALSYEGFRNRSFLHRVSPGTIVYGDMTSTGQLPVEYGFRPAVLVVASVVSHPRQQLLTCDAGHKTVSADAGIPNCRVVGHPDWRPLKPSEEHLPIELPDGETRPELGEHLYLLPRHICPTVNNFDHALIIQGGRITAVESVTARGRELPVPAATATTRY